MRVLAIAASAVVTVAMIGEVAAHEFPARRQIVAQADADKAMFLITWTSARGPQGSQMVARALWGRRGKRRQAALEALASREAIAGLEIFADGSAVEPSSIEVKVHLDTRQPVRLVAVVLVTVARKGAQKISIRNKSSVATRLMWTAPKGAARGPDRPRKWLPGRRTLTLTWTPTDVSKARMRSRRH